MLTSNQQASALNYAMRYDIIGFDNPEFKMFNEFLKQNPKLRGDILNFYKNLTPLTQRVYIALTFENCGEKKIKKMFLKIKKMFLKIIENLLIFMFFGGGLLYVFIIFGG